MSRWTLGLLMACLPAAVAEAGAPSRPNLVLIVADDLGYGDVGFLGRKEWQTPNLDRLARSGVVLTRCYAAAPICGPSRASLLTGRRPERTGVRTNQDDLPASERTIAERLKPLGYTSGVFGKWHRGRPAEGAEEGVHPLDQGFDEFFGFLDPMHAWEKFPKRLWDGRERADVSGYADDLAADRSIDFVRRHRREPFFLYLAPTAPHFNIQAPDDEVEKHRGKLPEKDPSRPIHATYAAMITRLDAQVGRLMDELETLGLSGNTLVVFTSDNGATFEAGNLGASRTLDSNRPFRGQKRTLWEGGLRVPAVASWPGRIPAGSRIDEPVSHLDLLPTLLSAAGATTDDSDGQDQIARWSGESAAGPERTLVWRWNDEGSDQKAALRGDLKLIVQGNQRPELYDVSADPAERLDISAEHGDEVEELTGALEAALGDPSSEEGEPEAPPDREGGER